MKSIDSLGKELAKRLSDPKLSKGYTIDDFFSEMGILKEDRTDFAFAAVLNQAYKIAEQENKLKEKDVGEQIMNREEAAALKDLMSAFEETVSQLNDIFTYVESKFELKNGRVEIVLKADNMPR